ncbi:DNA translocase FtsK [Thalassobacillus sp. CUG 92003]|uniref:DNA translocase FtsK n=1 Tax=Thalassobacillus sp. CUG 92003 TaxID=2736641 RepID=UPI0015E7844C|nr:DNA translocase FtsK [Thalassobacillus sp. CUG 92003]
MWDQLKYKLKQLFDSDHESGDSTSSNAAESSRQPGGETKMTYKYPKSGAFRFPVIPDEKKHKTHQRVQPEPSSKPAKHDYHANVHSTEQHQPERKAEAEKNTARPYYKESNKTNKIEVKDNHHANPFTPTEVPSPIYGFQVREDLKQTELETYSPDSWNYPQDLIRSGLKDASRQTESEAAASLQESDTESEEVAPHKVDKKDEDSIETTEAEQEEFAGIFTVADITQTDKSEDEEEKEEQSADLVLENEEMEQKRKELQDGRSDNEELRDETDSMPVREDREASEASQEKESEVTAEPRASTRTVRRSEQGSSQRRVPFNVIMTPRDKRGRDTKKVTSTNSETERKVDPESVATPPLYLLDDVERRSEEDDTWMNEQMQLLETTLKHFNVKAKVVNAMKGPSVTRFEVQPDPGVKVSKITNLSDDIKLSMAASDIRIEAPIPGKQAIGIEIPNPEAQKVGLQEIFESPSFEQSTSALSVALGLDIGGEPVVTNLQKMPHGLIAGATGSGKSVCINTILISLLYKAHYEEVKFLLIDPKMVELAPYNELPHLVSPVITDVKAATSALKWAVKEMEERYEKFVAEGVRDVERFNHKMVQQQRHAEKLPYLVIVIDELADLMMVSPQDVEDAICRIAQKARACGMHLLVATQRPSVDVITGLIKANVPTRIAFSVSSQVDSRTILDTSGAEKLLGKGDMLFSENGSGKSVRIQGAFVSEEEIERVTQHVKKTAPPNYLFEQSELIQQVASEEETDALFEEAVSFVVNQRGASASLLQRRFKIGYNRAARLIDKMEEYGIISEQKGSKPRDVMMTQSQVEAFMNPDESKFETH